LKSEKAGRKYKIQKDPRNNRKLGKTKKKPKRSTGNREKTFFNKDREKT
jgi:hypothetical protein